MFGVPLNIVIMAVGIGMFVMCLMVVFFLPQLNTEKKTAQRFDTIRGKEGRVRAKTQNDDVAKRRRNIQDTLNELEEGANNKKKKLTTALRLKQAGLGMSPMIFFIVSGFLAVIFAFIGLIAQVPLIVILGLAIFGGIGIPRIVLNHLRARRTKAFTNELPEAVDIIVRGIKAGLPLNDGMRLVASEAKEPLASEFRAVVETQQLGVPMAEAVQKLSDNIPIPETSFFATVIAIQQNSGGSLSEALSNLSKILRDRKKMRAKVKAISSEAKASAGIIGSLPVFVAIVVSIMSPDYIALLFTTSAGNIVLACGGLMMLMGILVMRKMINFEI